MDQLIFFYLVYLISLNSVRFIAGCDGTSRQCITECALGVCDADIHNITVEEREQLVLNFSESNWPKMYDTIEWFYGSPPCVVAKYNDNNTGQIVYYEQFCNESKSCCFESSKAELDLETGNLTIYSVLLSDENFYFYNFTSKRIDGRKDNVIYLEVHVSPTEIQLDLPESLIDGTTVEINCIIPRIKPLTTVIYWLLDHVKYDGTITYNQTGDKTYNQTLSSYLNITRGDNDKLLECVVVSSTGTNFTANQTINVKCAPIGPLIVISSKEEYRLNEKVTMVCDSNSTDGNLACEKSIWKKDGQLRVFEYDNQVEFLMQRSAAGNYTCQCLNTCQKSYEISDAIEIIFVETDEEDDILTIVLGTLLSIAVVLIVVLIVGYFTCIKRRTSQNLQSSQSTGKKTKNPNEEILGKRKVSFQRQKPPEEQIETAPVEELYEDDEITAGPNIYENYAKQGEPSAPPYLQLEEDLRNHVTDDDVYEEMDNAVQSGRFYSNP